MASEAGLNSFGWLAETLWSPEPPISLDFFLPMLVAWLSGWLWLSVVKSVSLDYGPNSNLSSSI